MNSFIGWIGGKRALRNEILQRMPADIGRYIEVFGGAGWVLFGREPSSKVMEVFNDYDAELVNIYRCIKYHPDALQHELDMLPDAREVFFDCRAQEQVRGLTDIQRAARSLYLLRPALEQTVEHSQLRRKASATFLHRFLRCRRGYAGS